MSVIAFYLLGGLPVYYFALVLGICAMAGLGWVAWLSPNGQTLHHVESGLWALVGGLIGGRLAFVIAHWAYFRAHLAEVPQVYMGGIAWPGAFLGGILVMLGIAGLRRESPNKLADSLFPLVSMIFIGSLWGCWVDGCAYGSVQKTWMGIPGWDEWGSLLSRLPVQILTALLAILIFWTLDLNRARFTRPGQFAALGMTSLCLLIFALSLLRLDPAPLWLGLRLDAWLALSFAGLSGVWMIFLTIYNRPAQES